MDGSRAGQDQIIKLAIMAVGGQGGGVLTNWIAALAEGQGWHVQTTAVAGVAQRTGATIYYIEMVPGGGRTPVFALAPAPGDVDVLIAAEWMEAGRAVQRGFVTPNRTTLIASTHRMLAVAEKIVPGDGTTDATEVAEAVRSSAKTLIAHDLQKVAVGVGSHISASLFGALAASGALPFPVEAFERTIRSGGRGAERSLAAFQAALAGPSAKAEAPSGPGVPSGRGSLLQKFDARLSALPGAAQDMARAGLAKVVDFQDAAYGIEYLDLVDSFARSDERPEAPLTETAAKFIANAMAYDDVIRVADLKTRPARFGRIGAEMAPDGQAMHITEFMHPRAEEMVSVLPAGLGGWLQARPRLMAWLDRRVNKGRRVRTDTVRGFFGLWLVAGLRPRRRKSLRHKIEMAHIGEWLDKVRNAARRDYDLAIEILACRRLIKGYSDTHARGLSKFDRVLGALSMLEGREDAADWLRRLREAALQDEKGEALDGALKTVASFSE